MISSKEVNEVVYESSLMRLFQLNSTVIQELLDKDSVKEFLELSRTMVKKEGLNSEEQQRFNQLLSDTDVSHYLQRVDSAARTSNYINGSLVAIIPGFITGAITGVISGGSALAVAALGLLGAIIGGHLFGELTAKVKGILKSWENKELLRKQSSGINVMQTQSVQSPFSK